MSATEAQQSGMRRLLETAAFSDATLQCADGVVFKAHRAILSLQSEFFWKAFQKDRFKEGNTGKVKLEIGESDVISGLLDYIYVSQHKNDSSLLFNAKLYVTADFYAVPSLMDASQAKIKNIIGQFCEGGPRANELTELPDVIKYIYENTVAGMDSEIRKAIVQVVVQYRKTLFDKEKPLRKELETVMEEVGAFGKDLGVAMMEVVDLPWQKVQCQECEHIWADSRETIPQGTHCPGCKLALYSWNDYTVD